MSPSHATKQSRRYRYYVSRREDGPSDQPPWRIPAGDLEEIVVARLIRYLGDPAAIRDALPATITTDELTRSLDAATASLERLGSTAISVRRAELIRLGIAVTVMADRVVITMPAIGSGIPKQLTARATLVRSGKQVKLVLDGSEPARPIHRDAPLIKLIAKAHRAQSQLMASDAETLDEAAVQQGLTRNYLARLLRLTWLAPDIISAILDGRQPASLTRQRLARIADLPLDWQEQRILLGYHAA